MMRRRTGFNAYQARGQLLEERQHVASLQLAADDHLAYRVDAVNLKNRLGNVETDRRNPLHGAILQIVVTTAATTSMALTCRWRSRPQHQKRTFPTSHVITIGVGSSEILILFGKIRG